MTVAPPMGSIQARRGIVAGATAWWSAANPLNSISGGTNVVTYADLTTNARDITQGTAGKRPTYGSGAGDTFDGVDDVLSGTTLGALIDANKFAIFVAFTPLAWSTTSALSAAHLNHGIVADAGAWFGISMRNVAGSEIMCWSVDLPVYRGVTLPATLGAKHVVCYRYDGTSLYASVNGGAEASAVCGNINATALTQTIRLGQGFSVYANVQTFEVITYDSLLSAADIATNVAFIRGKWGF